MSSEDRRGGDGRVTNLHFTQSGGEGPSLPVEEFCALGDSVKEFDLTVGDTGSAATPSPPVSGLPAAVATWLVFFFFFFFLQLFSLFISLSTSQLFRGPKPKNNNNNNNSDTNHPRRRKKQIKNSWPNLHKMKASFNSLRGEIPAWLATMKKLSYVKLRSNKLSGAVPPALAASPALFYLDVADNELSGALPRFGERLGVLDVSGNKLTGPVDEALGGAAGLQVVGLRGNPGLCGPVPSSARWAVGFSAEGTGLGKPCAGSPSPSPGSL